MTWMELLAQCCWKGTVILLAAFAANRVMRKAPAAWRHFLWTAVMAALLVLPAMVQMTPKWGLQTASGVLPPGETVVARTEAVSAVAVPSAWNPALLVWLTGCALVAGWFLVGRVRTWRMLRRAVQANYARELMDGAGGCGVRVLESARALTAFTLGVWRPLVVLPLAARQWPVERLRAALLHELMHVRRRDLLAQTIAQAACCLYWFHPLAWLAARQLRRERERACDNAVLLGGMEAHDYAQHLIEMVRALGGTRVGAMAMAETSDLEARVRSLLDGRRDRRPLNRFAALSIVGPLVVVLLPLAVITGHAQAVAPWRADQLLSVPLYGPRQQAVPAAGGSLAGSVQDPSAAFVPGCEVRARNLGGPNQEVTTTDPAGKFRFLALPLGRYEIEVRAPGFVVMRTEATVEANQAATVNARLQIGQLTELLEVSAARPSTPEPAAPVQDPRRIRVGGNVQAARLIARVPPLYPEDLKANGVTGTVVLRAVVTKQGYISDLTADPAGNTGVDPGLVKAAMDAVWHWLYQPTLLNGQPVAVLTTISVKFELTQ